jgi:hypothetical protein
MIIIVTNGIVLFCPSSYVLQIEQHHVSGAASAPFFRWGVPSQLGHLQKANSNYLICNITSSVLFRMVIISYTVLEQNGWKYKALYLSHLFFVAGEYRPAFLSRVTFVLSLML